MTDPDYRLAIHAELDRVGTPGTTTIERVKLLVNSYERLYEEGQARAKRLPRERLLEAVNEDRSQLLLLIADTYLDDGEDDQAKGWGWLAQHHKWPVRTRNGWVWSHWPQPMSSEEASLDLPESLHACLRAENGSQRWPTCRAALEAVVRAIADGKW